MGLAGYGKGWCVDDNIRRNIETDSCLRKSTHDLWHGIRQTKIDQHTTLVSLSVRSQSDGPATGLHTTTHQLSFYI